MEKTEIVDEKNKEEYSLVEVPTGSAIAIQMPDGKVITQEQAMVTILNDLYEIKKQVM